MKKVQLGSRDFLANGGGCPVEVFCRLRPPKDTNYDQQQGENSSSCVKIASSTELLLYSSENAKNGQIRESRYEFSHILMDNISQSSAFKELALPLLDDLIQGKSSVLFTYGITGSGKTYTMMGPLNNPGLIPRSLDVIFNSVGPYLGKKYLLRSDRQNSYEIQSEADILLERQRKEIQMTKNNINQRVNRLPEPSSTNRTLDTTSVFNQQFNENSSYFVFVTFVEIYNNYIYDLFDDDILNKAPQSKQLREDNRGRPYIKDVKEIEVRSSEEAIELLNMGLKRRRIAHTQLNTESSRSHSVLSMRLVQFQNDIPPTSLTRDDLTVSTIHLVDLAGSERVNRAKTVGERVKEASNINSSLMVLRQCFEILRENQALGISKMVPYRESKLTSFFKSYFDGEGRIRMILCVNPTVDGYEEIQHALKFGELTKDVIVPRSLPPPPPPPPAPPKSTRAAPVREIDNQQNAQPVLFTEFNAQALIAPFPSLEYSLLDGAGDDEAILILQDHLRRRMDERQRLNTLIHDQQEFLRKFTLELASDYDSTMIDQDDLSKENEQQTKTIRHLQTRIKLLEKSQNDLYKTTNQIERDNKTLKTQIEERNNEIKTLKVERRKDKNDFDNKMKIKLNEIEQQYVNEIKNKEIQMRDLERQHDDKLNIIRSMAASNTLTSEQFLLPTSSASPYTNARISSNAENVSEHVYQNQQQYHRVEMIISQNCNTPSSNVSPRRHAHTPSTEPMLNENGNGHAVVGHPRQQHRRSRSLSEIWLEHRPHGTVQTETLLQPKFHRKVCTQQAPARGEIARTTKYVLTHQNLDAQGEIVTDFVKGDVLPSSTGGVNVIFNDVERLTCTSPPDPLILHKRCQSEERILQDTHTQSPSSRQGPAVPPKRFRM